MRLDVQLAFSTYIAGRSQNFMYRFTRNSICVEHVRFSGCGAALYGFCAEVVYTAVIRQAVLQQRAYVLVQVMDLPMIYSTGSPQLAMELFPG